MEEFRSLIEGQKNMEATMSRIPPNALITPHIGTSSHSQDSVNNLTNCSNHLRDLQSLLEAILDEKHIEECLIRSKLLSYQIGHNAMYMNDQGRRNDPTKAIGSRSSVYRGVTKAREDRFEAFVWDNTDPDRRGKTVYIGAFANEIDAARAHDMVSIKIGGLNTLTNFPVRCYWREMEEIQSMSKKDYIEAVRRRGKGFTELETPFRGVYRIGENRRWEARLCREGFPTVNLGVYYTAEDAARAYDILSIKLKGYDAITNFDLYSYEVAGIMECVVTQQADGSVVLQMVGNNEADANLPNSSLDQNNPQNSSLNQNIPQLPGNPAFSHGSQNPNLISNNPYTQGNSSLSHGSQNPNLISSNPCTQGNSSFFHGVQNPNLIPSIPCVLGNASFSHGIQQSPNLVSSIPCILGNQSFSHGIQRPNLVSNIPCFLGNTSFSYGSQSPNLISSNPYTLGGFAGGAGTSSNTILNHGGEFPTQNATLQQSLQTQYQMNVHNDYNQNLLINNNQFLPQSSSIPLVARTAQNVEQEKCLHFPDWPSSFGKQLLGGNVELGPVSNTTILNVQPQTHGVLVSESTRAINGVASFGSEVRPVEPSNQGFGAISGVGSFVGSEVHPVGPSNQGFGAINGVGSLGSDPVESSNQEFGAIQLPLPELNQTYEPSNCNANAYTLNQAPLDQLNSCLSNGFPVPSSEPINNDSQIQTTESQVDLDMRNYLNRSYIEDNDFASDFDMLGTVNGGRQGL